MNSSKLDQIRSEAASLTVTEREILARELLEGLTEATDSKVSESEFRCRMKSYIERSWKMASSSFTISTKGI